MERTRRAVLASVGAVGAVGVAGCLGGSDHDHDVPDYDCEAGQPETPDEAPRPALGDPGAEVTVAAFEDFSCPHCATYKLEEFPTIREEYVDTGVVRYEHWDFPIPVDDQWSYAVPSAGRGVAARQGDEAFFEFSRVAYELQDDYTMDAVGYAAEEAGADPCSAIAGAEHVPYRAALSNDRSQGEGWGLSGTPTVFVDGDAVDATAEDVAEAVEAATS